MNVDIVPISTGLSCDVMLVFRKGQSQTDLLIVTECQFIDIHDSNLPLYIPHSPAK